MPRIAAAAVLAALLVAPAMAAAPSGGWSSAGDLGTARPGSILGVSLTDGRVLIAGMSDDDYSGLGSVDVYDPARGWTLGPKLDGDPVGAAAAPLPNGSALLAGGTPFLGGFDGPGPDPIAKAMTYDAARGAWRSAPDMSTRRNFAAAASLPDGRVLVIGGYDRKVVQLPNPGQQPFCCLRIDFIPLASTEIFDARTNAWSPAGALAQPRLGESAVTLKSGRVLVVGGQSQLQSTPSYLPSAELFNPLTEKWTSAGDIGAPRSGFTLTPLADGRALLAGGLAADGVTVLRSTLLYDPVANAWTRGAEMNDARTEQAAAALKDGRVLVSGGLDPIGRLATAEIFDPASSTWTETGGMKTARSDQAAITLQDGRVLIVGGRGSRGGLASSELFDARASGSPPAARTPTGPGAWTTKPGMPASFYAPAARLLKDGRVLVLPGGGYSDFTAQVYDPRTGTWATAFTRPSDQKFIAAVVLADDKVLLVTLDAGGLKPGKAEVIDPLTGASHAAASPGTLASARLDLLPDGRVWLTGGPAGDKRSFIYEPTADRWSRGPDVPQTLYVGTVTAVPGGRVLVGGIITAMILDPNLGTWGDVAGFPKHWNNYSATALRNGDVLLAGGTEDQTQPDGRLLPVATSRVLRWNHLSGLLEPMRDMPAPWPFHSTVVLKDGRVLFAGGVASGDIEADPEAAAEVFDPASDKWSPVASMPEARSQLTAVSLPDGTVLEVGGYGFFNPAQTLVYTPASSKATLPSTQVASPVRASERRITPPWSVVLVVAFGILVAAAAMTVLLRRRARR